MPRNFQLIMVMCLTLYLPLSSSYAQGDRPIQHLTDDWENCSMILDPSLTQDAWHRFTQEAGNIFYFHSLTSPKALGAGKFNIAVVTGFTRIDDNSSAWNDTFVHIDSAHYLVSENGILGFPSLSAAYGFSDNIDIGAYFTMNPGTNYSAVGGSIKYSLINDPHKNIFAAVRVSSVFVLLKGESEFNLSVHGIDLLFSRDFNKITPYSGLSVYLSRNHETTDKVNLEDENVIGLLGKVGITAPISFLRLSLELNFAAVTTTAIMVGFDF
ncbi:MAG: hypothetical protein V3S22_03505 [Candidatus Neomarinimicrobiota bacterium]